MLPTFGVKMGRAYLSPFDNQLYKSNGKHSKVLVCGTQQFCNYKGKPCKAVPGGTHREHEDVTQKAFLLFVLRFALRLLACYLGPLFDKYSEKAFERLWELYLPNEPIDLDYLASWKGTLKRAKERRELFCGKSIWITLGIDPALNPPSYGEWIFKKIDAIVYSVYHHTSHFGVIHYRYKEMCGTVPNPLVPYPKPGKWLTFLYLFDAFSRFFFLKNIYKKPYCRCEFLMSTF